MTGEDKEKPRVDIKSALVEFDAKADMLAAFCVRTKTLIEASLQDANILYQSVQFRVKARKKVETKYLDPKKNYTTLTDITDLAGLRVITYYEDDVDRVAEVIDREFRIDHENSIDKRNTDPDKFGYNALNYVCEHSEKRQSDVEYKKFGGVRCEIQVTSILRHAWAEIEHEWYDLKDAYPNNVKRRFYRIAALLELAESEFLDIRRSRTQYERSVAVRVEAKVLDLLVDAVSLKSFIEQEALVTEIDKSIALTLRTRVLENLSDSDVEVWSRAANLAGLTKLQDVSDSLKKYKSGIPEYVARCQGELWPEVAPTGRVSKGLCIYHLSLILMNLRGVKPTVQFLRTFRYNPFWDVARQVAIAKEIFAKY